jgi:hypothetical protein
MLQVGQCVCRQYSFSKGGPQGSEVQYKDMDPERPERSQASDLM